MLNRPDWDEYFIKIAICVSLRSEDVFIKHGSVIVENTSRHILGTGYNGGIKGLDKSIVDLNNREARRPYMIHSEENCILNCSKNPLEMTNKCTMYITAIPCINCLQRIINFGISRIVYIDRCGTITENKDTEKIRNKLIEISKLEVVKIPETNHWIKNVFI